MINLLTTAIRETFLDKIGKFQPSKHGKMTFAIPLKKGEEGYRNLEVVIYGPTNYVQVWIRETWTVISEDDLENTEDGDTYIKKGKDYTNGADPWKRVSNHDSCWPSGIEDTLRKYGSKLLTFTGPGDWFEVISGEFSPE